ncbi:HAMP domain-containing protein [Klebsiella pneumoniae]|nr:HAMP domain-containing protein [Klebsiella pneumoniae]
MVSAPLLLWLAWSLAKPARKLANAADEVAQGSLRQRIRSWKPGRTGVL